MPGIIEIITLLLGLAGFGAEANPKAPTPDAALTYAIPDADVVAFFDGAVVIPKNHKALSTLADQPAIKASPELVKQLKFVTSQVEGARGLVKGAIGLDFVTDIYDGALFVTIPAQGDPTFVAAVHGKFTVGMVDTIAGLAGNGQSATKVGGGAMLAGRGDDPAIGVTKDGVLLAGTTSLVKARLDGWKAPARPAAGSLAVAAEVLASRPIFAVTVALSATAKKRVLAEADAGKEKNFITDIVGRHKNASLAVYADGIGWTWTDKNKDGMESMATVSEGIMDLLRAGQLAPRGFAKIMIGALESYRGTDKQVDALLKRKADLLKLVETYTGDGNFKVAIDKDPKTFKVTARATAKTLSEVVPIMSAVPLGALVWFQMDMKSATPPAATPAAPPRPTTKKPVKAP